MTKVLRKPPPAGRRLEALRLKPHPPSALLELEPLELEMSSLELVATRTALELYLKEVTGFPVEASARGALAKVVEVLEAPGVL